jgi:hypothetical protein
MKKLGYYLDPDDEGAMEHGFASYLAPDTFPDDLVRSQKKASASAEIVIPDLPPTVQELVEELNDNLDRDNRNASALLIRKIIHQAVFIAMDKRQKGSQLKKQNGDDVDLSVAIAKASQEYGLSSQVVARVTSAKWIGDSANHSYRVKVTESDLEKAATGLRLFLGELL